MSAEPHDGMLPVPSEEGEIVSAVPAGTEIEPVRRTALPAVQAAAAAAGGFVAGAAVAGLVGKRHRRALARGSGRRGRRGGKALAGASAAERLQIVGSRSLLLDVHLLGGSGHQR